MPLDSAAVTQISLGSTNVDVVGSTELISSIFGEAPDIGAGLRAAREFRGLTIQDLANATRIRRAYVVALEGLKLEQLPSRPFTIGYVRAIAQALGLDGEAAVARFKRDAPDRAEPLRAPVGVSKERDPRLTILAIAAAFVLCAVLVWNLAQHAVAKEGAPAAGLPQASNAAHRGAAASSGAVVLSAAQPAPQESDAPAPYVTPGLQPVVDAVDGAPPPPPAPAPFAAKAVGAPMPAAALNPRAAVYGAEAGQSVITLNARKPASLIIRGADGAVYFARQLASGDSYRAPQLAGLTVEVSDPGAFDVYANGQFKGQLPASQLQVAKLQG